jgi:hypothetical protein
MGDGWIFLQISAPLSLIQTYQMNLISTGSISLDNAFKASLLSILIDLEESLTRKKNENR